MVEGMITMVSAMSSRTQPMLPKPLPSAAVAEFAFFHGPDKVPIFVGTGAAGTDREAEPFHGIVSRGLLALLTDDPSDSAGWPDYAHRLHDGSETRDERLLALRDEARRHCALSFRQSASAARRYVETSCAADPYGEPRFCEIWNIKEGHTSSVWRVAIHGEDGADEFVLNVARDAEAGLELMATAETMQRIAANRPDLNMAKVVEIAAPSIDYFGETIAIPLTRNELVRDAFEVHRGTHRLTGAPTYVIIERFLTDRDRPAEIRSIFGRVLQPGECEKLESDVAWFLAAASAYGPVAVDINEGDVVWDGKGASVVAIR